MPKILSQNGLLKVVKIRAKFCQNCSQAKRWCAGVGSGIDVVAGGCLGGDQLRWGKRRAACRRAVWGEQRWWPGGAEWAC
jgi:hypothetical protein